jgi:hypothetical protein
LEQLRASLEDRKKKAEEKTSASAVLVQRVQDGLERNAQKKKKSSEQEKVTKALQVLRGKKSQEESSSLKSDSEDDELQVNKKHDLTSRQRKLRKLSADNPGTLLVRGFTLMHEQLGTLYGDAASTVSKAEALQPAALRYLLTTAIPQMDPKQVGEETMRELRTLASTLDLVVSGRVLMPADILMQRYKSILMSIRDHSTAASKYLELIPLELHPTASTLEESDFARSMAVKDAKSSELLKKAAAPG